MYFVIVCANLLPLCLAAQLWRDTFTTSLAGNVRRLMRDFKMTMSFMVNKYTKIARLIRSEDETRNNCIVTVPPFRWPLVDADGAERPHFSRCIICLYME